MNEQIGTRFVPTIYYYIPTYFYININDVPGGSA